MSYADVVWWCDVNGGDGGCGGVDGGRDFGGGVTVVVRTVVVVVVGTMVVCVCMWLSGIMVCVKFSWTQFYSESKVNKSIAEKHIYKKHSAIIAGYAIVEDILLALLLIITRLQGYSTNKQFKQNLLIWWYRKILTWHYDKNITWKFVRKGNESNANKS